MIAAVTILFLVAVWQAIQIYFLRDDVDRLAGIVDKSDIGLPQLMNQSLLAMNDLFPPKPARPAKKRPAKKKRTPKGDWIGTTIPKTRRK